MSLILSLAEWALGLLPHLGTTRDELTAKAQKALELAGGDVEVAGKKWLAWFVGAYKEKLGDEQSAIAFGQQIWERSFGSRPAYNPDHFFNL